jgi:hypothetical protein
MFRRILLIITVLTLASLACGISVDLPISTDIKTGPTVTEEVRVPPLDTTEEVSEITLAFGAGELTLSPGAENALLEGTATYNVADLKPEIETDDNTVSITNGHLKIKGIPRIKEKVKNKWDFAFGDTPIDLTIKAGAYIGDFELGGLSLTNVHIADGAADVSLNFEEPNQTSMNVFRYETGASTITMSNLANANFETMIFDSGAGDYELDFSGGLTQDADVFIETGLSNLIITVPEGTAARVSVEGGLSNTTRRGEWQGSGDEYTLEGSGPALEITVEMSAGNLVLQNR